MKRIIIILLAFWGCPGLIYQASASSQPSSTSTLFKGFEPYVGFSGGVERVGGKRTDSMNEENLLNPPARYITDFAKNRGMSGMNATMSIFGGFLWNIPGSLFRLGPEIYLGRGNVTSTIKDQRISPFPGGSARIYLTDIQRKFFSGIVLRLGYAFYKDYLAYVLGGYEYSQFERKRTVANQPDQGTSTMLTKVKGFKGGVFGLGIEKKVNQFIVGIEFRMAYFNKQTLTDNLVVAAGEPEATVTTIIRPKIYSALFRIAYRF